MKKDILFVLVQFVLFALYFIDWNFIEYSIPTWICYVSMGILFLGVLVIILGILNLNDSLSIFPSPRKDASLISNGIYRYIRHPIYAGILIAMFAYSVYDVSLVKFIITTVLTLVFYWKSSFEEKLLVERYAQYGDYKNKTGRFFPKRKNNRSK